jgi:hypothetical protein
MTPSISKQWKCISITPPDRWARIAEEVISPSTAAADRARWPMAGWAASSANTTTTTTAASDTLWTRPLPRATPNALAAVCSQAARRCRGGVASRPLG